jgi:nuclease S1
MDVVTSVISWLLVVAVSSQKVAAKDDGSLASLLRFPLEVALVKVAAWLVVLLFALLTVATRVYAWGPEGHKVVALIAERNMSAATLERARAILGGESLEGVANWADYIKGPRRYTARWHYVDIPLDASAIDLERDCPHGACVLVKTEHFLAVLSNPRADQAAKTEALKFVVHFIGDMHQPLH